MLAADAATGTGDDGDATFAQSTHVSSLLIPLGTPCPDTGGRPSTDDTGILRFRPRTTPLRDAPCQDARGLRVRARVRLACHRRDGRTRRAPRAPGRAPRRRSVGGHGGHRCGGRHGPHRDRSRRRSPAGARAGGRRPRDPASRRLGRRPAPGRAPAGDAPVPARAPHRLAEQLPRRPSRCCAAATGFQTGPAKGWPDVCYQFFIGRDGDVWEGRAGSLAGPVTADATGGSQGWAQLVCLIGDFTTTAPTTATIDSLVLLLEWIARRDGIDVSEGATATFVSRGSQRWSAGTTVTTPTIAAHRDMSYTLCPGDPVVAMLPGDQAARRRGAPSVHEPGRAATAPRRPRSGPPPGHGARDLNRVRPDLGPTAPGWWAAHLHDVVRSRPARNLP